MTSKTTNIITAVLALLIVVPGFNVSGQASEKVAPDEKGPFVIQMQSFMIPAKTKKSMRNVAVTPYALVETKEDLALICRNIPRVQEALQIEFYGQPPLAFINYKPDTSKSGPIVRTAINKAIRSNIALKGYLHNKAMPFASGTAAKFPGTTRGCQRTTNPPEEIQSAVDLHIRTQANKRKKDDFQSRLEAGRKYQPVDRHGQ